MLSEIAKKIYEDYDFNCAETILYTANKEYNLCIEQDGLKMAGCFGNGMGIEHLCGAIAASVMVLGRIFVKDKAHDNRQQLERLTTKFLREYQKRMGSIICKILKENYKSKDKKCEKIILEAANLLEEIVSLELDKKLKEEI